MADNSSSAPIEAMPSVVGEQLRSEILDGSIEPGERINVRQIGLRLQVSAIPIREAIRRLEAEGLVETIPNVGAVAARVSRVELEDVYDLRRMIEPAIARRSVARMSDDYPEVLRNTLKELDGAERDSDGISGSVLTIHRRFHWELLAPAASPLVEDTLRRLWRISERYVALTRGAVLPVADTQHAEMVELCEHRDGDALADLLAHHLHLAANTVIGRFEQDQNTPEQV